MIICLELGLEISLKSLKSVYCVFTWGIFGRERCVGS